MVMTRDNRLLSAAPDLMMLITIRLGTPRTQGRIPRAGNLATTHHQTMENIRRSQMVSDLQHWTGKSFPASQNTGRVAVKIHRALRHRFDEEKAVVVAAEDEDLHRPEMMHLPAKQG
jgi:hypothetical protein